MLIRSSTMYLADDFTPVDQSNSFFQRRSHASKNRSLFGIQRGKRTLEVVNQLENWVIEILSILTGDGFYYNMNKVFRNSNDMFVNGHRNYLQTTERLKVQGKLWRYTQVNRFKSVV